ncbi:hypothetical protein AJ79_02179 [Helicocarpus griseus UAMH5409]|uniref:Uncharacterized protein n=1 Tax=Helicocarpus griseus UAMH5409 TaxID=1447875 RepID=A0A2B7Y4M0_9EURO|nr:hypothetical protein AJ79_02179 [Helicocarpus griseus UAMH5409]
MATAHQSEQTPSKKPSSQRPPPPFLFQGPPSLNTSNLSLPPGLLPGSHPTSAKPGQHFHQPPLLRQHSARSIPPDVPAATAPASPFLRPSRFPGQGDLDGADALWQEMQNTLAEVELTAMSGDHVFGSEHAKALEELRSKQLALALAWARSEADEVVENPPAEDDVSPAAVGAAESLRKDSVGTEEGGGGAQKVMDEKTEKDILLARKRREANDRYFDRVNGGVLDVVAKLEEVAMAMRDVERESKEIWNESDSGDDVDTRSARSNIT